MARFLDLPLSGILLWYRKNVALEYVRTSTIHLAILSIRFQLDIKVAKSAIKSFAQYSYSAIEEAASGD